MILLKMGPSESTWAVPQSAVVRAALELFPRPRGRSGAYKLLRGCDEHFPALGRLDAVPCYPEIGCACGWEHG
jgi:hypothetical protein